MNYCVICTHQFLLLYIVIVHFFFTILSFAVCTFSCKLQEFINFKLYIESNKIKQSFFVSRLCFKKKFFHDIFRENWFFKYKFKLKYKIVQNCINYKQWKCMCRALGKWIVCLRWSCVKNRLLQTFQRSLKTLIGKSNNNLLSDSTISSKHVLYHSLGLFWEHSILLARWIKPKWLQCKKKYIFGELQYSRCTLSIFCFRCRKFHFVFAHQTMFFFAANTYKRLHWNCSFITLLSLIHSLARWMSFNRNLGSFYLPFGIYH